jgi:hypothetical protein
MLGGLASVRIQWFCKHFNLPVIPWSTERQNGGRRNEIGRLYKIVNGYIMECELSAVKRQGVLFDCKKMQEVVLQIDLCKKEAENIHSSRVLIHFANAD